MQDATQSQFMPHNNIDKAVVYIHFQKNAGIIYVHKTTVSQVLMDYETACTLINTPARNVEYD
jgi:RNase P/RNase MRP subunit POP5